MAQTQMIRGGPGLSKWTLQPGSLRWLSPQQLHAFYFSGDGKGKKAEVHFTGKTLDGGAVFASSRANGAPVTFMLTQENVITGFIEAIRTMQPGERATFTIPPESAVTKSGCPASIPRNIPPNQALRFEVELISIITDVREDQGILKKTTKLGTGNNHPGDSDEVSVKYTACLEDGTLVSPSEEAKFRLSEGFFCPAFAHALRTMTQGEEAVLIIKPKYGFGKEGRGSEGNEAPVPPDATLHVKIQLISWKTFIGENQEILKSPGNQVDYSPAGKQARNQAVVKVRLIGKLEDGTVFDRRGHDGDEPFEFTIDEGPVQDEPFDFTSDEEPVIHSLDEAVLTMKEGEKASFTIPPQLAFGTAGSNQFHLAVVPPDSVVTYEIELLTVVNEKNPWSMTREECIEFAQRKEKEGDNLCNMEKYMRAYRRYYRASRILQPWDGRRDNNGKRDDEISKYIVSCLLKSARCAGEIQRHGQEAKCYREVLSYDWTNKEAQKMLPQTFEKVSVGIDEVAVHLGLELESPSTPTMPAAAATPPAYQIDSENHHKTDAVKAAQGFPLRGN